jgi:CPA2 family monovalent cation:H+ antiporter-2
MEGAILGELLLVIAIAAAGVALFERLRLPAIAGFLVMGALLGPSGLGLTRDPERIRALAELGVVFLLFEIGLELPVDALRRLWRPALLAGGSQIALTVAAVTFGGQALGLDARSALVLGGLVAMSSTALVMRVLRDRGELDAPHGRLCLGILLFQDVCIVPMLLFVPILTGELPARAGPIALALGKTAAALALVYLASRFAFPWLLARVAELRSRDLFSLLAFLLVLGSAEAAHALGLTRAVGAFSAGLMVAASPYAHQVQAEIEPLRGVLLGIFFTSVGMLFDPLAALDAAPATLAYVGAVVGLKSAVVLAIVVGVLRQGVRLGVLTALALAQTGEFSFVLAEVASQAGLLAPMLHQIFIAGSLVTLLATPFLMAAAPRLADGLARRADRAPAAPAAPLERPLAPAVLLVGFGLTGRTVARALRACGIPYAVVEANAAAVAAGRARGEPIVFGDATRRSILERVQVGGARLVSIAVSDPVAVRRIVPLVRALAPAARVVVRTRYVAEMDALYEVGASLVVAEEFEATIDLLGAVLRSLGVPANAVQGFADELREQGYEALRTPPSLLLDPLLQELLDQVGTEWVEVPSGPAAGRSLAELGVRARTGASVVAVRRAGTLLANPPAERPLAAGEELLVVGDAEAIARLRALLAEG